MDHTALFLAIVKTIRLHLKAQRRDNGSSLNDSSILSSKSSYKPTRFSEESRDVVMRISKLQEFLLEHRKDYINSLGHLVSLSVTMTDIERDQIDSDAQEFIQKLSEEVGNLRKDVSSVSIGHQCREHRKVVYESLGNYLKAVCKLYSEQKAIRVKRIVDRKRTARLQPDGLKKPLLTPPLLPPELSTDTNCGGTEGNSRETGDQGESPFPVPVSGGVTDNEVLVVTGNSNDDLTEEERAIFSQENEQMFAEMSTLVDEVRQVEGKVIEISRLQEIFAEKILTQSHQLDIVADQTVTSSENVLSGNEQVRQAIKNKASLRLWILFLLIMCSLSLLFLHWYSD